MPKCLSCTLHLVSGYIFISDVQDSHLQLSLFDIVSVNESHLGYRMPMLLLFSQL